MIKYICDYCNKEFFHEEEYKEHDCEASPYHKSKSIEMWKALLTVNLSTMQTNYKTFSYNVFEKEDRWVEWEKEDCYEKLFCLKENIEKVTRSKSEYNGVIMLEYRTPKIPVFEFIKPFFEEEIKKILQGKIDKLIEQKENFKL